ncbi:hypothetical protein BDV95DRAFT_485334 [Massariosphaeria phaeospora]|uniref:Tyrosinase copper-binding domain-containing protein n=1 Tax=Massariosphaeria phaeospora TaxID=100035 RepID=A0A7C8IGQ8_9PLEO|nr:hypothetical protein BDV95DRAFT_485334 [Massariosphaeria phaeospora]
MRLSFISASLAAVGSVSALPQAPKPAFAPAPALPLEAFNTTDFKPLTLEQAKKITGPSAPPNNNFQIQQDFAAAATCSNPRVRVEWDSYPAADRQAFVGAIKCLMGKKASGGWSNSGNRYEDLVALHQQLTLNVHGNSKFLIWHRYYLWAFEDLLRSECGFNKPIPWFDETKYSGRFRDSSIFSDQYFGGIAAGGRCITNGVFANLALNVGPGTGNTRHCLTRNDDPNQTINTQSSMVNACQARTRYADMAACAEGGAHAWGHNGIGGVMADMYASPGDPVFWLHHAFIDRNFRVWQNADGNRVNVIDGTDKSGKALTMDTTVVLNNIRPTVTIREIMNTLGDKLCYKYNY